MDTPLVKGQSTAGLYIELWNFIELYGI